MVHRGGEKNPYHLLDGVIPLDDEGQLFDRLLGLATDNLARPLSGCRPEAPFKARDHIEEPKRLYPVRAVECGDVAWLEANTVERDAKAEFAKMLKLWGNYTHSDTNSWNSTVMRRIEIQENPRERIKELLRVDEYEQGVRELMLGQDKSGAKRTIGIITGIITCTGMAVNKDADKGLGAGAAAQPVSGDLAGLPRTDMTIQGSMKKTHHRTISGAYKGEVVIACSYLPVFGRVSKPPRSWIQWLVSYLPWTKDKRSHRDRLQVGDEPIVVYGGEDPAAYKIGDKAMRGNMSRPLGAGDETSGDEESSRWEEVLECLEDPADLQFTIGRGDSMELTTPENGIDG